MSKNVRNKSAFAQGFWRGLAGPLALYEPLARPAAARRVEIEPLREAIASPTEALYMDWVSIGRDLDAAIDEYGKTEQKRPNQVSGFKHCTAG